VWPGLNHRPTTVMLTAAAQVVDRVEESVLASEIVVDRALRKRDVGVQAQYGADSVRVTKWSSPPAASLQ
jgi:hypothetical protein